MIIIDLFDIDFHIFTVIKFLSNLGVRIKYIYKMMDITPDNHFSSSNIATRVKARNESARRKTAHKQSQHLKTRNLGNTSSSEPPSHEY